MATDAKGNNHKAAGRPDGGQFDRKTGQGSDDDLDVGAVPVDLDEEDSIAVARYLDSLDPGVRFFMSDGAGALEACLSRPLPRGAVVRDARDGREIGRAAEGPPAGPASG